MQSNGDLVDQMIFYSVKAIIKECEYQQNQQSCYQFGTLQIDNWNDMFVLQIVSFCLGQVWILCAAVLIFLLKIKHAKATQKVDQEIKNNLQSQAVQGQVSFFQPVNQQALPIYSQNYNPNNNQQAYVPPPIIVQYPLQAKQNQDYAIGQPVNY